MTNKWRTPHPATMYLLLTMLIVFVSWICDIYGVSVINPQSGEEVRIQNLLNSEGIRWIIRHVQNNFSSFDPFGMAILALLGLGAAEHSGFINACLRYFTAKHNHKRAIILIIIVLGIGSSILGEIGYIILIPLAIYLFKAAKLPQQAGVIVAFVSVSCGFGANLFITAIDPMLMRYTQEAATNSNIAQNHIGIFSNYCFSAVSMLIQTAIIYVITYKQLIPKMQQKEAVIDEPYKPLSKKERQALFNSLIIGLAYIVIVVFATFSPWGILRGVMGDLTRSPFIFGSLFLISLWIGLMGVAYGFSTNNYNSDTDVINGLTQPLKILGNFLVICFFAAQLFACIEYSHLDQCLLVTAGNWFSSIKWIHPLPTLIVFILLAAVLNLAVTSGTLKWSILAYFAIPILGKLGVGPEITQASFRIGNNATTIVTPLLPYIPWVLVWLMHFDKKASFDTLIHYTWRYSAAMLVSWIILFVAWYMLNIPFGF